MSRIRGSNTKPERIVRSILHSMGLRFRLNRADLPGKPDVVLPKYRTVVLVHGCFWHRHRGCKYAYSPKSRCEWWAEKFAKNVERDRQTGRLLRALGWRVITVWECQTRKPEKLVETLKRVFASALPTLD